MASYLNKVQLIGNLGKKPEIRHSQDGSRIASFTLATTEYWKDKVTNERKDRTEWHKIVIFNERLVDICEKYIDKGSKIYLEGQLQTRKWTDNTGKEIYTTEVVLQKYRGELMMMDKKDDAETNEGQVYSPSQNPDSASYPTFNEEHRKGSMKDHASSTDLNDDIPF